MDLYKPIITILVAISMTYFVYGQNWTNVEGGIFSDYGGGIGLDNQQNIYISGTFSGAFNDSNIDGLGIAKYDIAGNLQWAWQPQYFTWGSSTNNDLVIDNNNNVYVIGCLSDTVKIGDSIYTPAQPNSLEEFFVTKLDADKNVLWTIRAQGYDPSCVCTYSWGGKIEINQDNNIYISIELLGDMELGGDTILSGCSFNKVIVKLDDSGNVIWVHNGGDHFNIDQNENLYIANNHTLIKQDDAGILQWSRELPDSIYTLNINEWDFLYISTRDTLYRLNIIDGKSIWTNTTNIEMSHSISADSLGNVLLSGHKFPPPPPPYYIGTYNEKYDSTGTSFGFFYWGNPVTIHNTSPVDISLMNDGYLYMLGAIRVTSSYPNTSSFIYGIDTLPNISNFDIFISKINISDWIIPVNIEDMNLLKLDFRVYPNPFTSKLIIDFGTQITEPVQLTLIDITGKVLKQTTLYNNKTSLNLNELSSGVYYLKMQTFDKQGIQKIIK